VLGREFSEAQKFRMLEVVAHEMGLDIEDELLTVDVRQLEDSPFDALLHLALRRWKILAIGYDLGGYRGCGRSRFSACD
jgi:hypothetical protein